MGEDDHFVCTSYRYSITVHISVPCNQAGEQNFSLFKVKITQICLLVTRIAATTIFIGFYKTSFSPYIASREAIHVRGTF